MTPERLSRINTTLAQRQPDLTVLTDDVHKQHNVSAIIRTCDAFTVPRVNVVWSERSYRTFRGRAKGSQNWVDVDVHENIEQAIGDLQASGMKVCAACFTDRAIDYRQYDFTQPTAILMGNEKDGVSQAAAALADEHLIIPMFGMVQSFNVSVAASLLLSEAVEQRRQAGMLDSPRLPQDELDRLFFEWCQPVITELCKRFKLPYPEITEDGHLVDPQAVSRLINSQKK